MLVSCHVLRCPTTRKWTEPALYSSVSKNINCRFFIYRKRKKIYFNRQAKHVAEFCKNYCRAKEHHNAILINIRDVKLKNYIEYIMNHVKRKKTTVTFYIIIIIGKRYKRLIESNKIICLTVVYISSRKVHKSCVTF